MKNLYNELENKIKIINKKKKLNNKKTAFFISNTAKFKDVPFYFSPMRETENFYYFGIVTFSQRVAKKICKIIDGRFDIIFVDTEKKSIASKKYGLGSRVNIEGTVKVNIKKTYLRFYKANDITVDAAENFLEHQFKNAKSNFGGKQILIIGVGNIGFKLSLRLVERSANVQIYRRDSRKLKKISELINFIKPKGNYSKVKRFKFSSKGLNFFDAIICCAKGTNIINLKNIKNLKKNIILLDVGKGMFEKNALKKLIDDNIKIFRLDVSASLDMIVENSEIYKKMDKKKYEIRALNNHMLVSNGLLGQKNNIIVDDVKNPENFFGICDGKGDFINLKDKEKKMIEKSLSKSLNKKINLN